MLDKCGGMRAVGIGVSFVCPQVIQSVQCLSGHILLPNYARFELHFPVKFNTWNVLEQFRFSVVAADQTTLCRSSDMTSFGPTTFGKLPATLTKKILRLLKFNAEIFAISQSFLLPTFLSAAIHARDTRKEENGIGWVTSETIFTVSLTVFYDR